MQLSLAIPVLVAAVFGLIVAAIELLIAGAGGPWPVRQWLSRAWVYACFCYIILYGAIRI